MRLPASVLNEGVLRLDWSGWSRALDCQRKGEFLLGFRRELDYSDVAQRFGRAIHAGLDVWQMALMAGLPGGGGAVLSTAALLSMEHAAEAEFQGIELPEGEHRHLGRAKEVLGLYLQERWEEDQGFEVVASEQSGEKVLGQVELWTDREKGECRTITVLWQFKIDGLWRDRRDGKLVVKDTKTSQREFELHGASGGPGRGLVQFQSSGQFKGYCWSSGARSVVVDHVAVLKPLARPTAKSAPRNQFQRVVLSFADEEIKLWRKDTLSQISQWLEACAGEELAPANSNSCSWPSVCGYWSVCEQGGLSDKLRWLESGRFKNYEFDPMRKENV